jgi:colanic acid/amylovoran biosynthesis glycosyltransferase
MRRLAYLFPAFPVLHQTFTLGEVVGLKRRGYDICLFSLRGGAGGQQQKDAESLIAETEYCPRLVSLAMWRSFWRALRTRPGDVARLFRTVVRAWATRHPSASDHSTAPPATTLSFGERLLAVYHHNAYVYLAKSLVLVPYAIWLGERLKLRGISHVHAHWATYPTTAAYLIKEWCGIPYSFTAHAYDIYMIDRMLPAKLADATFVVTCARTNRDYLVAGAEESVAARVHVNYHGADLARFSPLRHQRGARYRVMSCGWLKEYKGFHFLLDAIALLVERGIDATLDLAGDGPQKPFLERKVRELGISDRITFHGFVGHDRLADLYRAADAFALPSIVMGSYGRQDVIPNVLAEAMAVGIPVVGTRIGGVAELVDDGDSGLLVSERDATGLADALERIWEDRALAARLSARGREKVERIWNRERNLGDLAELINLHVADGRSGLAA